MMLADLEPGLPVPCRTGCPAGHVDDGAGGDGDIDLHAHLVPNPLSTFFMRVSGEGMRGHGIHGGDLLVIDRSVTPRAGSVVVVAHRGMFHLRPLARQGAQLLLTIGNGEAPLRLDPEDLEPSGLFGVVVHAVHHLAGVSRPWRLRRIGAGGIAMPQPAGTTW